jgi:hypothetical protein
MLHPELKRGQKLLKFKAKKTFIYLLSDNEGLSTSRSVHDIQQSESLPEPFR